MYIAMNRFKVRYGYEAEFERIWQERDSHLHRVPGFIEFHLLRGPENEDHVLYSSHALWQTREDFQAWTKSEAFKAAHRNAGANKHVYLEGPQFEGFEVIQHMDPESKNSEVVG